MDELPEVSFEGVVGHHRVKRFLAWAIVHPSHSYLFSGPEGVGKLLLARRFAQALVCGHAPAGCDCQDCRMATAGNHPDIHLLAPEGESIKIDQTRRLRELSALQPFSGSHVVNLIDQADRLTAEAAASLLKLLEEPPPAVINILVSSRPQFLPPTIPSRCLEVPFGYLRAEELAALLQLEGLEEFETLARFAGGKVGEALHWGEPERWAKRQRYLQTAFQTAAGNPDSSLGDRLFRDPDKRSAFDFLHTLCSVWRDLALWPDIPRQLANPDQAAHIAQLAPRRSRRAWAAGSQAIEDTLELAGTPVNMGMLLPVLLLELGRPEGPRQFHASRK